MMYVKYVMISTLVRQKYMMKRCWLIAEMNCKRTRGTWFEKLALSCRRVVAKIMIIWWKLYPINFLIIFVHFPMELQGANCFLFKVTLSKPTRIVSNMCICFFCTENVKNCFVLCTNNFDPRRIVQLLRYILKGMFLTNFRKVVNHWQYPAFR